MNGLGQTSLVTSIANAIAQMEGFNSPGTRPNVNNNPGDLISWSGVPTSNGFAQFPTAAAGWAALYQQVQLNINRGLSLNQFFAGGNGYPGYAPGGSAGNNPQAYASFVAQQIGVDPNTPLNTLNSSPPYAQPSLILPSDSNDPTLNSGSSIFDDSGASVLSMDTLGGGMSTAMVVGLLLGGLALYFYFQD